MSEDTSTARAALRVDEAKFKNHVDAVVRSSVEETLNELLDAEAEQICGAQRYERSTDRVDSRSGHNSVLMAFGIRSQRSRIKLRCIATYAAQLACKAIQAIRCRKINAWTEPRSACQRSRINGIQSDNRLSNRVCQDCIF